VLTPTPSRPGAVENALRLMLGRIEAGAPNQSGERRAVLDTSPPQAFPAPRDNNPGPRASQVPTAPPPAALPFSGQYRMVKPSDPVDIEKLGLDPNARTSMLPPPPPKKQNLASTVLANPTTYQQQIARSKTGTAALAPNAVVRRAR
jgi:hypothetical protein